MSDGELGIFEEEVGEFGEFTHQGDERDFSGFACGPEALIERTQHGVVSCRDERSHVEGGACQARP